MSFANKNKNTEFAKKSSRRRAKYVTGEEQRKEKKLKKIFSALLAGAIVLMSMPIAWAADDLSGHWAEDYISYMSDLDIMRPSSDGSYKPDQVVTRAEFMRYMNRAFHFTEKADIDFDDVEQYDANGAQTWYYEPIQIAVKYGYINGVGNNKMNPLGNVTREQAATILGRLHKYAPTADTGALTFSDKSSIGDWSIDYIADAVEKGYLSGYPDGSFLPSGNITRAELAKMLYQFMGTSLDTSGSSYTGSALRSDADNVTICEPCELSDVTIAGDLYITEGVLTGTVNLNNVTVDGDIVVAGGDVVMDGTNAEQLVISSPVNRLLQVTAAGNTNIGETEIQSSATLRESNLSLGAGGFSDLTITGEETPAVTVEGDVWDVTAEGAATITTTSATTIDHLTANGAVAVSGYGTVRTATVNADGCNFSMEPENLELAGGVSAVVAGEKTASENEVVILPTTITYDVGVSNGLYTDFTCANIAMFSKLLWDGTALEAGTDYRVTDDGIRLYSTWLSELSVGAYTLTAEFSDDTTGSIAINVVDSAQSSLEISEVSFDRYSQADNYGNVSVGVNLATGAVLNSVKLAGVTLTRGDDYTYNTTTAVVTLQKETLADHSAGTYTVTFVLSKGDDLKLTLNIEDSSPKNELSATEVDFDNNTSSGGYVDIVVKLNTQEDATLKSITGGGKTLELDWQYTYSGGQVTLSKSAISSLASATTRDYVDLTFNMSTGLNPVLRVNFVTTYAVVVNVQDDLEEGLEGVSVTVAPTSTDSGYTASQTLTTGSSGVATVYVKKGAYLVTASGGELSGALTRSITVSGKQTVTLTATIEESVNVYVVNSSGAAISGAAVTMGGQTATTSSSGVATFSVARGSYTVRVICSGYTSTTQSVTVTDNATVRVKMALS